MRKSILQMEKKATRGLWLIWAGVGVYVAAVLFSVWADRQLLFDGSWFIFRTLQWGVTSWGGNGLRFFSPIFEFPALLLAHSWAVGIDITSLIVKAWELPFALHPVASLLFCYWLLKRYGRLELFSYAVLSLAIGSSISVIFAANQSSELISLFWPAFVIACLGDLGNWVDVGLLFALSIALSISYEAAFVPVVLLIVILALRSPKKAPKLARVIVFGGLGLALLSCGYRILAGAYPTEGLVRMMTIRDLPNFKFQFAILAVIALVRLGSRLLALADRYEALGYCAIGFYLLYATGHARFHEITAYLNARMIGVILSLATACLFAIAALDRRWRERIASVASLRFVAFVLLVYASAMDFSVTQQWIQGVSNFAELGRKYGPGCHVLTREEFRDRLAPYGMSSAHMGILDIMLQKTRRPTRILLANDPWNPALLLPADECDKFVKTGMIDFFQVPMKIAPSRYFHFDFVSPALQREMRR